MQHQPKLCLNPSIKCLLLPAPPEIIIGIFISLLINDSELRS